MALLESFNTEYSYFRLSENKTINVFPVNYIVQLSKLMSQWANKYRTGELRQIKNQYLSLENKPLNCQILTSDGVVFIKRETELFLPKRKKL